MLFLGGVGFFFCCCTGEEPYITLGGSFVFKRLYNICKNTENLQESMVISWCVYTHNFSKVLLLAIFNNCRWVLCDGGRPDQCGVQHSGSQASFCWALSITLKLLTFGFYKTKESNPVTSAGRQEKDDLNQLCLVALFLFSEYLVTVK